VNEGEPLRHGAAQCMRRGRVADRARRACPSRPAGCRRSGSGCSETARTAVVRARRAQPCGGLEGGVNVNAACPILASAYTHTTHARTQHSNSHARTHARTKPTLCTLQHGHSQTPQPQPQWRLTMRRASSAKSAAALRPWPSANRNFHMFLPIAYLRSGPGRDGPGESTGGVTRRRREGARSATGFDAPPHAAARTEADVLVQLALHEERALPRVRHAGVPACKP
jgi:hypothetical protein